MTIEARYESEGAETQVPVDLVTLTVDDVSVSVPKGTLVIRAAELIGVEVPRFCDHPLLEPVGACRQCLVDVPDAGNGRGFPKPQASCTLEVAPGMVVRTQHSSEVAERAQRGTMELLLVNHPLDCPVCDKGGECPLQNQAMSAGRAESRFAETKRTFPKPVAVTPQVLLDRERCVLCARCTRFADQVAGDRFIALVERGARQQVGAGPQRAGSPDGGSYFSGNTIQICPVGALTSADYRFRARPFDLVSVPSVAEHDACGAAIRVDHRRGQVVRRLAGDDPEVNEEWVSDKDRFAFAWSRGDDRLRTPLVRDSDGVLQPMSWPGALAAAGRLLGQGSVGVLSGGRLTLEDAHAWSAFTRVALGTHDVDFRSRAIGPEEADFLAAKVAGTGVGVTYAEVERARRVVLLALEPEDEAATLFLRLRKAVRRRGLSVVTVASHLSRGAGKLDATLVQAVPGQEAAALAGLDLGPGDVLLVGERAALVPGLLTMVAELPPEVRMAWVPRRAGDRAAVEAGLLPNLLPGGRPLTSAEARADLAAAWGRSSLPAVRGRDTAGIVEAAATGELGTLLVGGVEVADLPDPTLARQALARAAVVSLEVRESEVTQAADVVLPVAPPVEKAGTFVTWEGRRRPFDQVLAEPGSVPDVRVLAGIAQEMGRPLGFRTPAEARADHDALGLWDGDRAEAPWAVADTGQRPPKGQVVLSIWRQMVDNGRGQDGQDEYRVSARPAVARANAATWAALGVRPGGRVVLAGRAEFPAVTDDLPDGVVWVPGNNGVNLRELGLGHGSLTTAESGGAR
ncbi:MAG: NADH-quinone oxidoreductase subunit G [Aeromicrobium sp.]|uniref:NADH-quinone oxidoreductase subunit G n=1 Tax=Aeromicrobium sp. TaxID=1871063 RepID=UPI0039E56ED3